MVSMYHFISTLTIGSLTLGSNQCGFKFSSSTEAIIQALDVTEDGSLQSPAIGPQRNTPSLPAQRLSEHSDSDEDSREDPEGTDEYWKLDARQAEQDRHDLRVFKRVHILPQRESDLHIGRSIVFFDIEIDGAHGVEKAGRIVMQLVSTSNLNHYAIEMLISHSSMIVCMLRHLDSMNR